MQPEQQTAAPQTPPQHADVPMQPIAQFDCWHVPEGKTTIFNYRKAVVVLYPGWMVVYQKSDHSELARIPLGSDLKMKNTAGFVRFTHLNGRAYGFISNTSHTFMVTPMWAYLVMLVFAVPMFIMALRNLGTGPASLEMQALQLLMGGVVLAMFFVGTPKANALMKATRQAAGVAS